MPGIKKGNLRFKKANQEVCPRCPRECAEWLPQGFRKRVSNSVCSYSALLQEVPICCDPSSPLPVETGRLASREGPGMWESRGKKMGGSKSKATVLENMIKNFKKGSDGDYSRKMTPS